MNKQCINNQLVGIILSLHRPFLPTSSTC